MTDEDLKFADKVIKDFKKKNLRPTKKVVPAGASLGLFNWNPVDYGMTYEPLPVNNMMTIGGSTDSQHVRPSESIQDAVRAAAIYGTSHIDIGFTVNLNLLSPLGENNND